MKAFTTLAALAIAAVPALSAPTKLQARQAINGNGTQGEGYWISCGLASRGSKRKSVLKVAPQPVASAMSMCSNCRSSFFSVSKAGHL